MNIPQHVEMHWRYKWHMSPAQIKALEARFVADYRRRLTGGTDDEPPVRANEIIREQQRQRVAKMAEMYQTMTQAEVGAHFGVSPQRVSQLFRQFGVETRGRGRRASGNGKAGEGLGNDERRTQDA